MYEPTFDYATDGFGVPDSIVQTHRSSWDQIARAGSHWSGAERVEIARQARAARAARTEPPWLRGDLPGSDVLSADALDAVRTIAADAMKIGRAWASAKIAILGDAPYVELGAVVATSTAIDAFAEALGRPHEALPEPRSGAADGERLSAVADAGAYVPMMDPWSGPNVGRAMSLVPQANALFMSNVMAMYNGGGEGTFYDLVWDGPLSRPQAEVLAARVSAVNECFY